MRLFVVLLIAVLGRSSHAVRNLRIASPLQAFTIWDRETPIDTPRSRFLPRLKAGLTAEVEARKSFAEKRKKRLQTDTMSSDWSTNAAAAERQLDVTEDRLAEQAFENAASRVKIEMPSKGKNPNKYQFVGVINSNKAEAPITWYAREKPEDAKWSVRLIHVNRQAIIKDLFSRGKVDVFAQYENSGRRDEETNTPIITSKYSVRERSWK